MQFQSQATNRAELEIWDLYEDYPVLFNWDLDYEYESYMHRWRNMFTELDGSIQAEADFLVSLERANQVSHWENILDEFEDDPWFHPEYDSMSPCSDN
jgi:hypothetical protein